MTEPTQEHVISIVSSIFGVEDVIINDGSLKFKIRDKDFKTKFVTLARQLEFLNMLARVEKDSEGIYVFITSFQRKKDNGYQNHGCQEYFLL